jgi:hypothetical protein
VGLVEDEERARLEVAEPVAERAGVGLVAQERVRQDEAGVGGEGVDAVASFAAAGEDEVAVEDGEGEAEAAVELVAPLEDDGGGTGDDDPADALPHEELADDEARFDRLSEADVVGDEEPDAGHPERLAERLELVGLDLDAGAERGLHEARVGGGDAVPAEGVEVGREELRRVEAGAADGGPARAGGDGGVDLALPEDGQLFALGVVVEAGEADEGLLGRARWRDDLLDEEGAGADAHELTGGGKPLAVWPWFGRRADQVCSLLRREVPLTLFRGRVSERPSLVTLTIAREAGPATPLATRLREKGETPTGQSAVDRN